MIVVLEAIFPVSNHQPPFHSFSILLPFQRSYTHTHTHAYIYISRCSVRFPLFIRGRFSLVLLCSAGLPRVIPTQTLRIMSNPKVLMLGSFTEEEMKVLHTICSLSKRQSLLKTELTKAVFHFRSLNFAYKKPLGKSGGTSSKEEDGSKVKPEQNGPLDSLDSFEGSNSDPPASSSESGFRFVTSNLKVLMLDLFTEEEMKVLHTIDSLLNRHSLLETQLTKAVFYLDSLNFDNKKSLGKSGGTSSKEEEGSKVRPEQNGPLDSLKKVDETKNVKTDTPIKENGNASVLDAAPSYLCSSNGVKKDEKDHCDFSSAEAEDGYLDEFPTLTLQNGITEFPSKASNGALPLATKLLPRRVFFLPK